MVIIGIFFSVQVFIVAGESMAPTYIHDEYTFVDTITYRLSGLERGDIIVFDHPHKAGDITMKRVVGMPNESLVLNNTGLKIVSKNGQEQVFDSMSLIGGGADGRNGSEFKIVLGPEDYFVLGDNRSKSTDSREWGAVQMVNVIGRPVFSPFSLMF